VGVAPSLPISPESAADLLNGCRVRCGDRRFGFVRTRGDPLKLNRHAFSAALMWVAALG
jgi:hypothetical protein